MTTKPLEIEGTWEQIASHAAFFAGRRLRLIVLPEDAENTTADTAAPPKDTRPIEAKIAAIVADVPAEEWSKLPSDLGDQLDHYIYGVPKRPHGE